MKPDPKRVVARFLAKQAGASLKFTGLKAELDKLGIPVKDIELEKVQIGIYNWVTVKIHLDLYEDEAKSLVTLAKAIGDNPQRPQLLSMGRNHLMLTYHFGSGLPKP